ncbi:MAG TPA: hypothetical protein VMV50_03600 [Candidatus Paceibacterota bacterium]|nr:hypothetical protein [Candidatus Paceibacterota bacterium]
MNREFSLGSFTSGLVLGVLLACAWFLGGASSGAPALIPSPTQASSSDASPLVATPGIATTTQSSAVSVADQPAGGTVAVESVTVPPPGVWVAVREVDGTTLGNVLGAARVGGPRTNVTVSLLRDTAPGREYAVELYRDDGNGVFDLSQDSVYVDFNTGEPVIVYFATNK